MSQLIDLNGQPLRKEVLTKEVAGPSITGVRSPYAQYPTDGMNPGRLAQILRDADQGEPLQYFELAELIEERDLHYAGVLGTRKRSVAQIDVTVEAASEDAEDVRRADMVRTWLKRDELADDTFDILDAVGKGVSFTEIIWDTSEGQWQPTRLEWRDPRWFRFDRQTMRQPLLRGGLDGMAEAEPLPAFKFIFHQVKAKSGLPVRSGIARLAAWAWMFKAFTQRDWAIFTQTYGQPVRIGRFHEGATKEDKATLFRAVANIAGDCAAIIPRSMEIEFIESKNVTAGSDLYEHRADWLDRQVSKGILGQTTTTDAVSGGHAVSQEHRKVQEDIETADCKSLSATLNRCLVRPWMDLEFGPSKGYPRIVIARPKQEDLKQLTESLQVFVPMGLRVEASEIRDKLGLAEPEPGAEVLTAAAVPQLPLPGVPADGLPPAPPRQGVKALPPPAPAAGKPIVTTHSAEPAVPHPAAQIAAAMQVAADPAIGTMIGSIQTMLAQAQDLAEFREMLSNAFGDVQSTQLAAAIAGGIAAAQAAGRADLAQESGDL